MDPGKLSRSQAAQDDQQQQTQQGQHSQETKFLPDGGKDKVGMSHFQEAQLHLGAQDHTPYRSNHLNRS